jgi:Uma2 family endonuclease
MAAPVKKKARGEQRLVLYNIDWRTYCRIGRVLADRRGLRLTYDRGTLEIMTLSPLHERLQRQIGRFIETLTEELNLPIAGYGSMTFKRRKGLRGLEPDQCYWIAHEAQVRARKTIDFQVDPPPDLVLEVDITSSSINRMAIYRLLKVPEVWCFDGQAFTFHVLQADDTYAAAPNSLTFAFLRPPDLLPFLALHATTDENAVIRQLRSWVRQQAAGTPPATP